MLGNITLVQPLERLYSSTFQRQWDRTVRKIMLTSPGELEELDAHLKTLERTYELSGIKKLSTALGTYPDGYASKIRSLRSGMCETIARKFRSVAQQITDLVGDPDELSDFERDRRRFDEALALFRMLRAFYKRWKLYADDYRYAGERYDFQYALKDVAYRLAKKRALLMKEYGSMKKVVDYKEKLGVLGEISDEVTKLFEWYRTNYLNVGGSSAAWTGADEFDDDTRWMPVDFLDYDPDVAPLERFRKVPTDAELADIQKMFDRFVDFYRRHELVDINEIGLLSDYARFRDYSANFSLYSEDAAERLKAGLMEHMLSLHKVMRDAKERVGLKRHTEKLFESSFAMYFGPVDEVYRILKDGFISSGHSVHHKYSRAHGDRHYDSIIFSVDSDIKDGDIGFIFPLTKVIEGRRFYQVSYNPLVKEGLSESNTALHVFSNHPEKPLKIDIRQGIFVAPRDKIVRYTVGGRQVRETSEQYFRRFFATLANCGGADWFECDRLQNWLSRHCVFYDDGTRVELLNMLRNKSFVSVINKFMNKKYDNLALSQVSGTLKPSEFYVTHRFENMPEDKKEVLGSDTFNLTLFEWERTQD
ncbi:hypothetical protein KY359_01675 [Candidatus Woesearchaeota archaeon]|nr:hypothetical protein [Candidatus Woesearchaeota archaeon]